MHKVKYINPYNVKSDNNGALLSLIKGTNQTELKTPSSNLDIPVISQHDVSEIINGNDLKILQKLNESRKKIDVEEDESNDEMLIVKDQVDNYQDLTQFMPTNFKDQLMIVSILNFPNLKKPIVEKVLNLMMQNSKIVYNWTVLNNDINLSNEILLFLKFHKMKDIKWFISKYHDSKMFKIKSNDHLQENLKEVPDINVEVSQENLESKLKSILSTQANFEKITQNESISDLDSILKSYNSYKIDNNDLIDVPNYMKESIIKNIIKFRSKMLIIENEKRQKEIEIERIKTKNKLKNLFQGIKEQQQYDSVEIETIKQSDRNEYEQMNDEEYSRHLDSIKQKELESKYQAVLKKLKLKQIEGDSSFRKLDQLKNYESILIDSKMSDLDETKNYHLSDAYKLYTNDYNQYQRVRSQKRIKEELLDEADIQEEMKQNPIIEEPKLKKSKVTTNIVITSFSPKIKQKLQNKIIELVEEYLGINDDFLIQVINEHLEKYSLEKKNELISDLSEVLDEDSENLVNDLYEFIEKLDIE